MLIMLFYDAFLRKRRMREDAGDDLENGCRDIFECDNRHSTRN
jgi:hypothetical protein